MRIFLVEDEVEIAETVAALLSASGYTPEVFSSGDEFIEKWDRSLRGCLLLDMRMPGLSGLDVLKAMGDASRVLPVILFSSIMDMQVALTAGQLGVFDFCPKPFAPEILLEKVRVALEANKSRVETQQEKVRTIEGLSQLSKRETEILDHLCQGLSSKQIAECLKISPLTVDNHRARIFAKMSVNSVSHLVQLTLRARQ